MKKSKLWKHVAALIYDIFPILGIFLITSLFLVLIRQGDEVQPRTLWLQLLLFSEVFLYFTYSWKKGGQTLGMRAWKIGIEDYPNMTWSQVSVRFFAGLASTLLLGAGLWTRSLSNREMTWMDMACQRKVFNVSGD